ncbi:response regulator transcription factor [Herbaspirillum lusitanum]|jgi:DNA-binding response OmpR family regulator|uniref:Response regulator transcription factor n=1 Tax=Herbaspirillum lusitanum TaxID=213312 RepID=A0ABW9A3P9_9BURK
MNVLLVEDDPILTDGLSRVLNSHGFNVHTVNNGMDALAQRASASVFVLDIGLPDIDGFEVLRRLRAAGNNTPVLLLTARDTIPDRVHGLELGADDYLVKPFATPELVARIKALLRRSSPRPEELSLGGLSLDNATKRASIDGRRIDLSLREWTVLEYLMQQAARVVSKQQIIDAVLPWGEDFTLNAVEVYVSRIRLKIAGAGVAIRTIRGFGYMLEKSDEVGDSAEPAATDATEASNADSPAAPAN